MSTLRSGGLAGLPAALLFDRCSGVPLLFDLASGGRLGSVAEPRRGDSAGDLPGVEGMGDSLEPTSSRLGALDRGRPTLMGEEKLGVCCSLGAGGFF